MLSPRRLVPALLLLMAAATAVGLALLWPAQEHVRPDPRFTNGTAARSLPATATALSSGYCGLDAHGAQTTHAAPGNGSACELVEAVLHAGPDDGRTTTLVLTSGPGTPTIAVGDHLRVVPTPGTGTAYGFYDFDRRRPLLLFGIVAALVLVAVARLRGLAAMVGLAAGGAAVVGFVLPAILDGENALPVALTGSAALLYVLLYVVHGPSLRTSCALLGTLVGLGLVGALAYAGVHLASLFGQDEEQYTAVQALAGRVDIRSLIIAGFVVGAIGALNDVTVTQASAVWELTVADPSAPARQTYRAAMRIGRDHIASAAYTLVFAYVGAALPTLLILTVSNLAVLDVVGGDDVAIQLVAALVGVVGLVLVVPITTALSVAVARSVPADRLRTGHAHGPVPVGP